MYGGKKQKGGAVCTLCNVFKPSGYGNTTNMRDHVLSAHKDTEEGKKLKVAVENKRKEEALRKQEAKKK